MALLKESVDATLSFDAEMFPRVDSGIGNVVDFCTHVQEEDIIVEDIRAAFAGVGVFSWFTLEDIAAIKSKIREYDSNHKSRSGGSELLKCLQHIQTAKESLAKNIAAIKEILQPKAITRTTLAEATALAEQASIKRVAATFTSLPEKMLRSFAEQIVGDAQLEYTAAELPVLIATKQISGVVLEPGKVV